jgi:hypothetical protein
MSFVGSDFSLIHPKFMLFGAQAPPRPEDPRLSTKALVALPSSPSVIDCCKLLCNTVSDSATGSVGRQHTPITTLDSCGPGAWTTPGKLFTPALPAVDKYKPEYFFFIEMFLLTLKLALCNLERAEAMAFLAE